MNVACTGTRTCAKPATAQVVVTAWGIHVPGADLTGLSRDAGYGPACPPEEANELLGRKGLLYKEPATRLALCAVHRALRLEPRVPRASGPVDARTAVVVSSNLGNIATVHKIVRTIRRDTARAVSALDAPNASSNVIASTIAIWFRFGGPNLMVCSGATSGFDALDLSSTLLRAARADRVIVVGVEPDDEVAQAMYRGKLPNNAPREELRAGAACVVLERASGVSRGYPTVGRSRSLVGRLAPVRRGLRAVMIGPIELVPAGARVIDMARRIGDLYGAMGVLQLAVTASMESTDAQAPDEYVLICGSHLEGWRTVTVNATAPVA